MGIKYDKVFLIKEDYEEDAIGQEIAKETKSKVFCEISSISQSEFKAAGQSGIKPECVVVIWEAEYNDQRIIEINGKRFTIYRSYSRNDGKVELYAETRIGNE